MRQEPTFTCDVCGETVFVRRLTAYEFSAPCRCDGLLSWAHKSEPPAFDPEIQGELF